MNFSNPAFVYATLWCTVLCLHSMRLLAVLEPINLPSFLLVVTNIIIFFFIYIFLRVSNYANSKLTIKKTIVLDNKVVANLETFSRTLLFLWIIGTLINILYSGGVPLYWMITGDGRDYRNYGIPTFVGLVGAINAFLAVSYFIIYLKKPKICVLIILMALISWPLVAVARGNFTYILLEMLAVYILLRKSSLKSLAVVIFGSVLFVYLFGVIGDFRAGAGAEIFKKEILNPEYIEISDFLPSGVLYVYAYITTPFNNVVYNISSLDPNLLPFHSLRFLIPTVLRDYVFSGSESNFVLVSEAFNTVTFYPGYLADFGIILTVIIISFYQFGASVFYLRSLQGNIPYIMAYSVAFQCLVLSVFNDNFTMHTSIFQLFLAFIFSRAYKRQFNKSLSVNSMDRPSIA